MLLKATFGLSFFVIGPVAPYIIDDYDISYSEAGLLTGLTLLATTLALPGSMLVGRIPLKALITGGWLLAAAPALTLLAFGLPHPRRHPDPLWRFHRHSPSRSWPAPHVLVPPPRVAPS